MLLAVNVQYRPKIDYEKEWRSLNTMTEMERVLIHCLKAFGVNEGAAMEISLRAETEKQQKEMLNYMADNRSATPENLLAEARRISGE